MWMLEKLLACNECGTRLEEWDKEKGGDRRAYQAETFVCPGCAQIQNAIDAKHQDAKVAGKSSVPGLKTKLTPRWLIDYQIKNRTPEDREKMRAREQERLEMEQRGGADEGMRVRNVSGLGGGRRPSVAPPSSPESPDSN